MLKLHTDAPDQRGPELSRAQRERPRRSTRAGDGCCGSEGRRRLWMRLVIAPPSGQGMAQRHLPQAGLFSRTSISCHSNADASCGGSATLLRSTLNV